MSLLEKDKARPTLGRCRIWQRLHFLRGWTTVEIAAHYGVTRQAVNAGLRRVASELPRLLSSAAQQAAPLGHCERCGEELREGEGFCRRGVPVLCRSHFHPGGGRTHFRPDTKRGVGLLALDQYLNERPVAARGSRKRGGRPPLRKGGWAGERQP